MIIGNGIDIVELERISKLLERQPRFITRVLTANEQRSYAQLSKSRKIEYVGGRFAAKEAFAKAYGTGIGSEISFQDIEIINNENGKPVLNCTKLKEAREVHVSVSHSKHYALANVIIEA
ncbi:holo-ACP synthase [Geomicrobium sp. JCM 19038]|uniref:holo-ACP synthase n=1 Tax=Geomicrobium sp. JCM 19038 TaxID=1460635 RepID=UPI00045F22B4|nr:holo-ACP synthase [Geomicrobium sp. JCM 19038]GAK09787.1 holo-[acyl-carrier protein] synthase [Geomicrobium sp. JCM 19038]